MIFGNPINYEQEKTSPIESSLYIAAYFTWSPQYPDVGEKITFISNSVTDGIIIL